MMSSTSPCSSANLADDILYGDGNNKFVQPTINTTSTYLNISSPQVEITSTHQSQTLKHFLAQKYAAESTSDGDTESHSNNRLPNNQQSSFPNAISNPFYPFSPLVSSSSNSHFDSRNILSDGVLESSIDSLQVESSTNNNNEQVSGHSSNNHSNSIFNDGLTPSLDNFIKHEEDVGINANNNQLPPPVSTPTNVTSSSNSNRSTVANGELSPNICRVVEIVPSNLFNTVSNVSDITVDSTTATINHHISQPTSINNSSNLPSGLSFQNFPASPLNQQSSPLPSVLTYGLSPNFSTSTLLQIETVNPHQIIPSLTSPTIQQIDHYFNQHHSNALENKKEVHQEHQHQIILDQHQLLPASATIQSFSTNENPTHCLISDNSLSDQLFHDIHNQHENYTNETDIAINLHENVISDLPVLTRARASLPIDYLYLHETENSGMGVFARKPIPKRTQFGPIEGVIVSLPENQYLPNNIAYSSKNSLFIFISENFLLSQADENSSNWTRFVRPASNLAEQNLELITKEFSPLNEVKFYFYTTRNIMPSEELKVWYSQDYAQTFNIKLLESDLQLLNENESNIVDNKKDHSFVESPPTKTNVTTGHKLRNKIAKTQMVQNFLQGSHDTTNRKLVDHHETLVDGHATLNESHNNDDVDDDGIPSDLFNSEAIQQMVSTESTILNGNNSIQAENTKTTSSISSDKVMGFKQDEPKSTNKTNLNNEKPKYQCDKCQKIFPRHYSLRRHLVMHSGEKRYKCPICGMAFNHVYNRNRHIKMHKTQTSNNSNEVNNNNKVELNRSACPLNETNSTINNKDSTNSDNSNSGQNIRTTENTSLVFNQQIIVDSSDQRENDKEDKSTTIDSSSGQSSNSSSQQVKSGNIKLSDVVLVTSSGPLEKQSSCSKQSLNKTSSSSGITEKLYRCSQCYKRFSTKERLEKHGIVHDESAKKLSCDVCDRKFLTNSALSCHLKYHQFSADEPRKYDCTLCDKVFENIQLRREHVSVHINPDTGLFHCPKCPKTFEDFSIIRKHLKSFHSNEIFPCTQCPKVFPRQDKLRLHMLCHIDRWEFKCNFCEKQFKRKDKLKEHTQRMHAPDRDVRIAAKIAARMQRLKVQRTKKVATKPSQPNYHEYVYKCHQCLFGFKRRGMLVNHLAKRHPEIPYNTVPELNMPIVKTSKDYYCQYCEKVYKSSSKRKAHIIKNHPGKSLPPSNRNKTSITSSDMVNQSFSATVGSITINPHFCDWCHKQYASKAKLMQHQRKKHPDKLPLNSSIKQKNNNTVSTLGDNGGITTTTPTINMYKLNTVITGDKATFTTVPITPENIKSELNSDHQMVSIDLNHSKMDHFLSHEDDSPATYMNSFNISNHYNPKDNNSFLNGTSSVNVQQEQVHYTIDSSSSPSFEDLMNINIVGGSDVNHNLNSINSNNSANSNSSFTNNVITILGTTFTSDLSEFSDIITHISDFQTTSGKHHQILTSTNHHHNHNSSVVGLNESNSTDLLISGAIVEDNNWNQVCEEMAIV